MFPVQGISILSQLSGSPTFPLEPPKTHLVEKAIIIIYDLLLYILFVLIFVSIGVKCLPSFD